MTIAVGDDGTTYRCLGAVFIRIVPGTGPTTPIAGWSSSGPAWQQWAATSSSATTFVIEAPLHPDVLALRNASLAASGAARRKPRKERRAGFMMDPFDSAV